MVVVNVVSSSCELFVLTTIVPTKASCHMKFVLVVAVSFNTNESFVVNISISICLLLVRVFVALGFVVVGTVVIICYHLSFVVDFILSGLLFSICFA